MVLVAPDVISHVHVEEGGGGGGGGGRAEERLMPPDQRKKTSDFFFITALIEIDGFEFRSLGVPNLWVPGRVMWLLKEPRSPVAVPTYLKSKVVRGL